MLPTESRPRVLAPPCAVPGVAWRVALVAATGLGVLAGTSCSATGERAHLALGAPFGAAARQSVVSDSRGYLLLADGSMHFADEGTPQGLYVAGVLEGGRFIPEGDVQGEVAEAPRATAAPEEQSGILGWFILGDASFCKENGSCIPAGPYVEGALMPDGTFVPSSRKIKY